MTIPPPHFCEQNTGGGISKTGTLCYDFSQLLDCRLTEEPESYRKQKINENHGVFGEYHIFCEYTHKNLCKPAVEIRQKIDFRRRREILVT